MIADLTPYPEYRNSGLPWLGQVPRHWNVVRNGGLFGQRNETGFSDLPILEVSLNTGVRVRNFETSKRKQIMSDIGKYKRAAKGDVAYNMMRLWQGAVGISPVDGLVSPAYIVARPYPNVVPKYFVEMFRTAAYMAEVDNFSRGIVKDRNRLYWDEFKQMLSPHPPSAEQAAIVRFLDWVNGRLNRTIRAKRKVVALLEEQKRVIIHHAVTRGLNPVRLKPSGISWLNDIPQHWDARKLKFEMSFRGGGTPSKGNPAYWGGTIPWVSPKDMKSEVIRDAVDHITERAVAESSTNLIPAGSLLMVVRSGILQRAIPVARCVREVALNQDMKALTSKGQLDLDYFVLFIRGCEEQLLREWTKQGATVESVEHQYLANTKVPIPPLSEQRHIVSQLAYETTPFTIAGDRLQREIELLREYRTRLTADVVTGKLDVRKAALRLPEEAVLEDVPPEDESLIDDDETAEAAA